MCCKLFVQLYLLFIQYGSLLKLLIFFSFFNLGRLFVALPCLLAILIIFKVIWLQFFWKKIIKQINQPFSYFYHDHQHDLFDLKVARKIIFKVWVIIIIIELNYLITAHGQHPGLNSRDFYCHTNLFLSHSWLVFWIVFWYFSCGLFLISR